MSIWFTKNEIGKKIRVNMKNGNTIEGILLDIDPVIKIDLGGIIKKFLETKIEDVDILEKGIINYEKKSQNTPFSFILDAIKNNKIKEIEISFEELKEELIVIKNEDFRFYLDVKKYFDKLEYAYKNNLMEFKFDKTRILLHNLKKNFDDEFVDKMIIFILKSNNMSYKNFFKEEPLKYFTIIYDFIFSHKKEDLSEAFLLANLFFCDENIKLNENNISIWYFFVEYCTSYSNYRAFEKVVEYYSVLNINLKKIFKYSVAFVLTKLNLINGIYQTYIDNIDTIGEKEVRELVWLFTLSNKKIEAKNDSIDNIKIKYKEFLEKFEYEELYNYLYRLSSQISSKEFNELFNKSKIYKEKFRKFSNSLPKNDSPNYVKAKKAELIEEDYKKASHYFQLSIDEKEKRFKSAIKDYILMIMRVDINEAIKLINRFKSMFEGEEKISFNNLAWQVYKKANMIPQAIHTLNAIINQIESKDIWIKKYRKNLGSYLVIVGNLYFNNKEFAKAIKSYAKAKKYSENIDELNRKIAECYIEIGNFEEAENILNYNIENYADLLAKEMLYILEEKKKEIGKNSEKVQSEKLDLVNINYFSLNNFLKKYINTCEYKGLSVAKQKNKIFDSKDLKKLTNLDNIKNSKEKADRLLTAYRVAEELKEDEKKQNNILADSLIYYANYLIINNNLDLAKNFYLASLMLKKNQKIAKDFLYLFLNRDPYKKSIQLNEIVNLIKNKGVYDLALSYLALFSDYKFEDYEFNYINLEDNYRNLNYIIDSELDIFSDEFRERLYKFDSEILFDTDKEFWNEVYVIVNDLKDFQLHDSFIEKNSILKDAIHRLNSLNDKINQKFTIFTEEYLKNFVNYILDRLEILSQELIASYKASLDIFSPTEKYNKLSSNEISLTIKNQKDLANAEDIIIKVLDMEENIPILRGGESNYLKIPFKLNKFEDFSLDVEISYFNGAERIKEIKRIPISFEDEQFVFIENPYTPDGDIVTDKNMFFGREELLDKLVNMCKDDKIKAFTLYGQKRVGKSTLFHYLKEKLKEENFFVIYFSMGEAQNELAFYKTIGRKIRRVFKDYFSEKISPKIDDFYDLIEFLEMVNEKLQVKNLKLIILIDEFTYLYKGIKETNYPSMFLKNIKALLQNNLFILGVIGQNSMPMFIKDFPNELAVFKKEKISYLDKKSSIDLMEKPILFKGKSRYKEDTVEYIYELTAGSPYYIQKICYEIVEYLNEKEINYITRAHLNEILEKMFLNMTLEGDFDNLISIGDGCDNDLQKVIKDIIIKIAHQSRDKKTVSYKEIEVENSTLKKESLQHLIDSDILIFKNNRYSLRVKLLEKFIQQKIKD